MADEATGEYRRFRREIRVPAWALHLLVTMIALGCGIAIAIGRYESRFDTVEQAQREQAKHGEEREAKLAAHDTAIAVLGAKLDTVIQELGLVNTKLDRLDDQDGSHEVARRGR